MADNYVQIKVLKVTKPHQSNYMKFYDEIKNIIGDKYELFMVVAGGASLVPSDDCKIITYPAESDQDHHMKRVVDCIKSDVESGRLEAYFDSSINDNSNK